MQPTGYDLVELAEALARVKHAGQVRKGSGEPYFNHLKRVAGRVIGWRAKTVAFLHDIIENQGMTAGDLRRVGFPWDVVDDVLALSRIERIPSDAIDGGWRREGYFEFIARTILRGSDDALYVKLGDLADNLYDPWTQERSSSEHQARYIKSDLMIRAELVRRDMPVPGVAA